MKVTGGVSLNIRPHDRVIFISSTQVAHGHPHGNTLAKILWSVGSFPWECVECASYQRLNNSIVRTTITRSAEGAVEQTKVRDVFSKPIGAGSNDWIFSKKAVRPLRRFVAMLRGGRAACSKADESRRSAKCKESTPEKIECFPAGHRLECVDDRFGLFRVP